jgi:hypothetical protein
MGHFEAGAYIDEIFAKAGNPERAKAAGEDKKWEEQLKKARAQGSLDRAFWQKKLREDKLAEKRKLRSEKGLEAATIIFYTWLKKWASQSKIVSTVIATLNKLLGLLIDVILMPYLPYIMAGLLYLADAIMAFQEWWVKNHPDVTPEAKSTVAAGQNASKDLLGSIFGLDWSTAAAAIAGAIIGLIVAAGIIASTTVASPILVAAVVAIIAGALAVGAVTLAYWLGGELAKALGPGFGDFLDWIWKTQSAINTFILGSAATFTDWMLNLSTNLTTLYNEVSSTFQNIMDVIIEKLSMGLIKAKQVELPQLTYKAPQTMSEGGFTNVRVPYQAGTTTNNYTTNTNVGGESLWAQASKMWGEMFP